MCLVHSAEGASATPVYDAILTESRSLLLHLEPQHRSNSSTQMYVDHWKEQSEEDAICYYLSTMLLEKQMDTS